MRSTLTAVLSSLATASMMAALMISSVGCKSFITPASKTKCHRLVVIVKFVSGYGDHYHALMTIDQCN